MQKFSAKNRKTAIFWHMKGKFHQKHGFTMIEIMVVIVIIGVLAGVGTPKLFDYTEKVKEKADLMKLYYLRDALNRALIENENALYNNPSSISSKSLNDALKSNLGVDLFIIEMRPDQPMNVQHNHESINKNSQMSKLVGNTGTWYDALNEAGFEGVADIIALRNGSVKGSLSKDGETYRAYSYTDINGKSQNRTTPKKPIFISYLLNHGKDLSKMNASLQGGNVTNYRLKVSIQWSGRDEHSQSVEVALVPASAIMWENGAGGALLSEHGVCFSTYGDAGCANYRYNR